MKKKVLFRDDGKRYFVKDSTKDYHSENGIAPVSELKKSPGTVIKTKTGKELSMIDAGFHDEFKKIKKKAQTIPIKDLGFILAFCGLGKDDIVVEAGTGSGASAIFFSRYVKKVYSYDIRDEHMKIAEENINNFGVKNVVTKIQDLSEKMPQKNASMVLLDMPEPWTCADNAFRALKPGGFLVSYVPNINQAQQFVKKVEEIDGLLYEDTVAVTITPWKIQGRVCRPHLYEIPHSAFLGFARKIKK